MTIKIVGHWERGWDTPYQEFNWWFHPLNEFAVDEFCMSPVTGLDNNRVSEYSDLNEIIAQADADGATCVYIDEDAMDDLPDYEHPENAVYIMGRTGLSPYKTNFRPNVDQAVRIPSNYNNGGFWGHQAAIIILYDRYLKNL